MTTWTLLRRSLRFHARAHAGVVLGAIIGSAALTGALLVGDSVKQTLRDNALARLGPVHFALYTPDRLFQEDLRRRVTAAPSVGWTNTGHASQRAYVSALYPKVALMLPGLVTRPDGSARANQVQVLGVESPGWPRMAGWRQLFPMIKAAGMHDEIDEVTRLSIGRGVGPLTAWERGEAALINEALARRLGVRPGDEIVVRVHKPGALGLDAAISPRDQDTLAIRVQVGHILPSSALGDFSLLAQQLPAANVFLPLDFLAKKLGVPGSANLLVAGSATGFSKSSAFFNARRKVAEWLLRRVPSQRVVYTVQGDSGSAYTRQPTSGSLLYRTGRSLMGNPGVSLDDDHSLSALEFQLQRAWLPEDAGLSIRAIEQPQGVTGGEYIRPIVEISTSRIFLEPAVVTAALHPRTTLLVNRPGYENDNTNEAAFSSFVTNGFGVLTYLANLISSSDRSTPYSMVTAADAPYVPPDMRDDEILVNEWLAEDLQARPGDQVQLSYFVVDSGSRLTERTNAFRVRHIVPLAGIYADRTLMPEFPGVAKAESTHDWDAGFPLVYTIREKDEAYWKQNRGTPKAFITLAAGQRMWTNRFGSLTAIRYLVPTNSFPSVYREAVCRNVLANLSPDELGLRFQPVRQQALKAAEQSQDFGQLFLGFSIFLVVSALLLMSLLFRFGLEQRLAEAGTLLALGFTARQVRRLFLREGVVLALLGGVIGAIGGISYAKAMIWALTTVWRSAVNAAALELHASAGTLVLGFLVSTIVAVISIWLTLRTHARQPVTALLAGEISSSAAVSASQGRARRPSFLGTLLGLLCLAAALFILLWAVAERNFNNAEAFFSAGALLLISGLVLAGTLLRALAGRSQPAELTRARLAVSGSVRRRSRSLATIALLASGTFVIAALGVFRLEANKNASQPSSGTGGFALIGSSTLPVLHDLNTAAGRAALGLSESDLEGVRFVPFRVHEGDEASCLNLNRAQNPRLLSVDPNALAGRFTFAAAAPGLNRKAGWAILSETSSPTGPGTDIPDSSDIPAIGDANSIQWALGKKLGETLNYTDERGRSFKVHLSGAVANSILQGSLIVDESEFIKRFPNESGYRFFLIDAPTNALAKVSASLSRALQDLGFEVTPAVDRLNTLNAVQNTYLGTFQILGGLGLLLGSAGLGVVVLRNVLERRAELGLLIALGFRRRTLYWLVFGEHAVLLASGLGLGVLSAAVAVLPSLLAPGAQLPSASVVLTLAAVLFSGLFWTWLATRVALRGKLLDALRNE